MQPIRRGGLFSRKGAETCLPQALRLSGFARPPWWIFFSRRRRGAKEFPKSPDLSAAAEDIFSFLIIMGLFYHAKAQSLPSAFLTPRRGRTLRPNPISSIKKEEEKQGHIRDANPLIVSNNSPRAIHHPTIFNVANRPA